MKNIFDFYTSESVSAGHPDKVCDQISDALLDMFLAQNPFAHVAVETLATTNLVILAGELKGVSMDPNEVADVVRQTVREIGYDQPGFHYENLNIENYLHEQSEDIVRGVGQATQEDRGAGDQGTMIGFACNETEAFMPAPIYYAHKLLYNLQIARKTTLKGLLRPDAKSQVTLKYANHLPIALESVVLSTQHHPDLMLDDLYNMVFQVISESIPSTWLTHLKEIHVNPTGRFVIGGPHGDTGLTGRKLMVDTYGCLVPHGGGAFSGKDPTKVDRSGAYMMRYLAKNIVAAGLCNRCTLQISYIIGKATPLALNIDTHSSEIIPKEHILQFILENFDLTPQGIRTFLKLNRPIYKTTASYGHFGRVPLENGCFSWEKLDAVDIFKRLLNA